MAKSKHPSKEDVGAAFMAWYADAIRQYPEGLVTQAQAATMLCIRRMAVSRLVGRGHLRAVYFPREPQVGGMPIWKDDPTWLKLVGWFSNKLGDEYSYAFPQACYVSFADVVELWQNGDTKKKCARSWDEIVALAMHLPTKRGDEKAAKALEAIRRQERELVKLKRQLKNRT